MTQSLMEQVKALEIQSRLLSENLIDAIWIVDYQTRNVDYVTPSIETISGYSPDEWLGKSIEMFLDPESLAKSVAVMEEEKNNFRQGKKNIRAMELKFIRKNGNTFWGELKATLIKEEKARLKVVGTIRDITPKKTGQHQLEDSNRKLVEALEEKEKLLKKIKVLEGLLPICSACKRIRDENGRWWPLDLYVKNRTDAEITHTICQDCKEIIMQ